MNEKTQAARESDQGDLLEQIFTQGLEKIKAPPQEHDGQAAPEAEAVGRRKNERGEGLTARNIRKSSVYLYLLVMFGAAFLMLLLAYFIQQRSNENTISGLRDSMNLSRAELLEQIKDLEDRNTALHGELSAAYVERAQWQRLYEEAALEASSVSEQYETAQEELYSWASFWMLEYYYQLENYEACAAVLLMQEQGQYPYRAPDRVRQAEIIQAVVDEDILDEEYAQHPEDYQDLLTAYSQP